MLTENQIQRIGRLVRLAPWMTQEQREGLLRLVGDLKAADAAVIMPQSAIEDLVKAVGDQQVREIVSDLRSGRAEPGFLPSSGSPPKERGTGWQKPTEWGGPPGLEMGRPDVRCARRF